MLKFSRITNQMLVVRGSTFSKKKTCMFKKHHQAHCCFSVSVLLPLAVALGDYGGRQEPTEGPGLKNKSTAEVPKTVVLLMPV